MIKYLFLFLLFFANYFYAVNLNAQEKSLLKIIKPVHFSMPLGCTIGEDCWVMNYVDFGPGDGVKTDPYCLAQTYDDHKGTDFALLDGAAMLSGVNVLAAADGVVARLRDGEKDGWHTQADIDEIRKNQKECGNGIFIDHDNGVQSIYCHLKKGSLLVKKGQRVKKGDKIGQVGQSGMTEFPHLHFGIIKYNKIFDPFTGQSADSKCGEAGKPLWEEDLGIEYQPVTIQALGFLDKAPVFEEIEKKIPETTIISINSDIILFWATLLGVREGDEIIMEVKDPNGKIFMGREIKQDKTRARQFYYTGKKITDKNILEGAYTGEVKIIRDDKIWYKTSAVLISQ